MELQPGQVFAGHRIEGIVGRGGMGVVYRAIQLDLERVVALKVIGADLLDDDVTRERFLREAKAGARIDHPNVIPVYYAGESEGTAYIAMRYVEGDDVRSLVRREGRLPAPRAARIAAQAGAALDAIHGAGFVHRDVKPANLLLGPDDHVYVSDFGLAKHTLSVGGATKTGHWVGTLDYVAPEQIRGEGIDARTDVYALGCLLFYMLAGEIPFPREGQEAKLWAHLSDPPPALPADVPPNFDGVVGRALEKLPADRYPSAGDLGRAALAAVEGRAVSEPERVVAAGEAKPVSPDDSTVTAARPGSSDETRVLPARRPRAAWLALPLVAAVAVAAVLLLGKGEDDPEQPTAKPTATAEPQAKGPRVARRIPLGIRGNGVAVAAGSVWVTGFTQSRVLRADVETGKRVAGAPVAEGAADVAALGNFLWIANSKAGQVVKVDARSGRATNTLGTRDQPVAITVAGDDVWVAGVTRTAGQPDSITRFNRLTGQQTGVFDVADGARAIAVGGGSLWVVARRGNRVLKYSTSGKLQRTVQGVGEEPYDVAYGAGAVWVTTRVDNTLVRIDPKTGGAGAVPAGITPEAVDFHDGEVWVASRGDSTVRRFSAKRRPAQIGEPIEVDLNPVALTVTDDAVWVSCVGSTSLVQIAR
jgi:streptogramin lyase